MARNRRGWVWWAVGGVVALLVGWATVALPVTRWVGAVQAALERLGPAGAVIFAVAFVAAVVALVPGWLLTITAGAAYGAWGAPIALVSATVGAAIAFLIARHLARRRVVSWIRGHRRVEAVEQAVNEEGWKVVGLLRLSPLVPFNLQNYALGVTRIPFGQYLAATFVGIAPGTMVNVYVGALGREITADRGALEWTLLGAGLAASAALVWLVARKARRKLAEIGVAEEQARG